MSDEVRRAVVERVKSPLSINLSFLYPDAAIHFLKCPSHSVIASFVRRARRRAGRRDRSALRRSDERARPSRRVEPVVEGRPRPERQGPSRTSAGVIRPLSTRRSSARAARASTSRRRGLAHATSGGVERREARRVHEIHPGSTQDDPGFRSAVHRPAARRARAPRDGQSRRPRPTRPARAGPRASSSTCRCHRIADEADRRRINPASTRSRPVARERDAWTTMHRRRQSDIQIAHQHVTIQHDHRKISDFCPRGRTTRLSLCADHPFIRHVCLSPATWLSPACPERTPSF